MTRLFAAMLVGAVKTYQLLVSPWLGAHCRYYPSCSEYFIRAVDRYGPWRGGWKGAKRILRCHPWGGSGYDPP